MNSRSKIHLKIAHAAARILAEEGVQDYFSAKQKAAGRLGIAGIRNNLPNNEEIDIALKEYHRLYRARRQPQHIIRLLKLALEAMNCFADFSPWLVGAVLEGSAGEFSPITVELFPDSPEEVVKRLLEIGIPFTEKNFCYAADLGHTRTLTALCFVADDVEVQLVVIPTMLLRQYQARKKRKAPRGDKKSVETLILQGEALAFDFPQPSH